MKRKQKIYTDNASYLSELIQGIDVVKIEIKEMRDNSQKIQKQVKSVIEDANKLKAQSIALRSQIETFFEDKQCYKKIADLTIQYK